MKEKKLIVIHGAGATFAEAIESVARVSHVSAGFADGVYYLEKSIGTLLRKLLQEPEPALKENSVLLAIRKAIVAQLLTASLQPDEVETEGAVKIYESSLLYTFAHFGIPFFPAARETRANRLREEADRELRDVFTFLAELKKKIAPESEEYARELRTKEIIAELAADEDAGAMNMSDERRREVCAVLEAVRDMHEVGGDLDTVTSALFYTYWLHSSSKTVPVYGRDYRYVFVNYHQGIRHLEEHGPSRIYMADFPIGAWPNFEEEVRDLAKKNIRVERFEDHHPYTKEQKEALDRLVDEGLMGFVALSGPLVDDELGEEELLCGADMVHKHLIEGKPWDCDGARELRKAAHSEDFVSGRYEMGYFLTEIIKGGICKVELVEMMLASIANVDLEERLINAGWKARVTQWREYFTEIEEDLLDHAYLVTIQRPEGSLADTGGKAMGDGSDMPVTQKAENKDSITLLISLALTAEPGKPKLDTGRAVEFYKRRFPEADYIFYCYGSFILVARRLNQADLSLNLGAMMPLLGGEGDGGHAGAAVCRPENNEHFPKKIFERVTAGNFKRFASYLTHRLGKVGYTVIGKTDRSVPKKTSRDKGGKKLAIVVAIAVALGGVLLFFPPFRPKHVRESNKTFFPEIENTATNKKVLLNEKTTINVKTNHRTRTMTNEEE